MIIIYYLVMKVMVGIIFTIFLLMVEKQNY